MCNKEKRSRGRRNPSVANKTEMNMSALQDDRVPRVVTRRCPVCGDTEQPAGSVYNGFQLKRCISCELVYTEVREFPESLYTDVYASQWFYREMLNAADRTARGEWGRRQLWWFKKLALRWLERGTDGRRLLDVGCGPGTFLLVARQEGWDVAGIEPAQEAASKAIALGLNVFQGYVKDYAALSPSPFDAIVSFEVLEHVPNPVEVLQGMRALLKPGGMLVLSVPNLDDPYCLKQQIALAMPPIHINFFNRRSLGKALQKAGFAIDRFYSLPIPTSSVRNTHGKKGLYVRLPWLALARLIGRADGTTLLAVARPSV
jgi:2-polyprenyl-3-methyl-5-hydroxy-6-metoxy-1,4-benzoquinol methylase